MVHLARADGARLPPAGKGGIKTDSTSEPSARTKRSLSVPSAARVDRVSSTAAPATPAHRPPPGRRADPLSSPSALPVPPTGKSGSPSRSCRHTRLATASPTSAASSSYGCARSTSNGGARSISPGEIGRARSISPGEIGRGGAAEQKKAGARAAGARVLQGRPKAGCRTHDERGGGPVGVNACGVKHIAGRTAERKAQNSRGRVGRVAREAPALGGDADDDSAVHVEASRSAPVGPAVTAAAALTPAGEAAAGTAAAPAGPAREAVGPAPTAAAAGRKLPGAAAKTVTKGWAAPVTRVPAVALAPPRPLRYRAGVAAEATGLGSGEGVAVWHVGLEVEHGRAVEQVQPSHVDCQAGFVDREDAERGERQLVGSVGRPGGEHALPLRARPARRPD
eukprot:scaffold15662_cov109-Isochrysis_galbana.AAC.11